MAVAGQHVRMHDVKGFFPVQPFGDRQRGPGQQPAAYILFARIAQRQAARIVHLDAVHNGLLGRPRVHLRQRGAQLLHHRQNAHHGNDHDLMPPRFQRLGLLVHIEAVRRVVRLPVNHHQNAQFLFLHSDTPSPHASYRSFHVFATSGQANCFALFTASRDIAA